MINLLNNINISVENKMFLEISFELIKSLINEWANL